LDNGEPCVKVDLNLDRCLSFLFSTPLFHFESAGRQIDAGDKWALTLLHQEYYQIADQQPH
jgi:hypothetical protein